MHYLYIISLLFMISCGSDENKENPKTFEKDELEKGSIIHPLEPFDKLPIRDNWELEIQEVVLDATEDVLAENMFNDPPEDGYQFLMIAVKITYLGEDRDNMLSNDIQLIGDKNVAYNEYSNSCGVIPNDIDSLASVFTNGYLEGNICFSVPSEDIHNLKIFDDNLDSPKYMKIN